MKRKILSARRQAAPQTWGGAQIHAFRLKIPTATAAHIAELAGNKPPNAGTLMLFTIHETPGSPRRLDLR
jgi:hypothetical protein